MITIWKLELDSWSLVGEFTGTMQQLNSELESLRSLGGEYRAELRTGSFSSILEA